MAGLLFMLELAITVYPQLLTTFASSPTNKLKDFYEHHYLHRRPGRHHWRDLVLFRFSLKRQPVFFRFCRGDGKRRHIESFQTLIQI